MYFASDNSTGMAPEILAALATANGGPAMPYGADDWTLRAERAVSALFERDCAVFFVASGTAANALALASVTPPWGAVFCHATAHIVGDECGAPEFYSSGAKLIGLPGDAGKVAPETLTAALRAYPRGLVKRAQPAALSLTQSTECGTLYQVAEVAALSAAAHAGGLAVHMDGARFANAIAALGCTPADMTWKAGVDLLSFGATKNGTACCEAIVVFDPARATDLAFRRKRAGHTLSKNRFVAAQMLAYLSEGLWLRLARRANDAAAELAARLTALGLPLTWPCQANEVFVRVPAHGVAALRDAGAQFYEWESGADTVLLRLVTSFATEDGAVAAFADTLARTLAQSPSNSAVER